MKEIPNITMKLLTAISDRLSGRKDCRQVEYLVSIGICDEDLLEKHNISHDWIFKGMNPPQNYYDKYVVFEPVRLVYPNCHDRKESHKLSILEYVANYKLDSAFERISDNVILLMNSYKVSPGIYKYTLSFEGRRRRWERLY